MVIDGRWPATMVFALVEVIGDVHVEYLPVIIHRYSNNCSLIESERKGIDAKSIITCIDIISLE